MPNGIVISILQNEHEIEVHCNLNLSFQAILFHSILLCLILSSFIFNVLCHVWLFGDPCFWDLLQRFAFWWNHIHDVSTFVGCRLSYLMREIFVLKPLYPQLRLCRSLTKGVISQSTLECRYSSICDLFILVSFFRTITFRTSWGEQFYQRILDTVQFALMMYTVDYYLVRAAGDVLELAHPLWCVDDYFLSYSRN